MDTTTDRQTVIDKFIEDAVDKVTTDSMHLTVMEFPEAFQAIAARLVQLAEGQKVLR